MGELPEQSAGARRAYAALERRTLTAERKAAEAEQHVRDADRRAREAEQERDDLRRQTDARLDALVSRIERLERGALRSSAKDAVKPQPVAMTDTVSNYLDLLNGYAAIGSFLGWPTQTAKRRALDGVIPTFKIAGTVCARRSTLLAWIEEQSKGGKD